MIEFLNFNFSYKKDVPILEDINLQLQKGRIYGLLGENGGGKTTLMKAIAGLVFPKSGEVKVWNYAPRERKISFLSKIFFVPEHFDLPAIQVTQYVDLYAPFYSGFNREIFHDLIERLKVGNDKNIGQLSFGQKKKFLIAFAIACGAQLILMDEPTNGLDIPSKSTFRQILAQYIDDERTFIISTHQVRDLDNLIDSVIVLHDRKIHFQATTEKILEYLVFENNEKLQGNEIYVQETLGGYVVVKKSASEKSTKLDLELLYKATLSGSMEINEWFNTIPDKYA